MSARIAIALSWVALGALAQPPDQQEQLPPGHPQVPGNAQEQLPPGHPQVPGNAQEQLPPGHPQMPAGSGDPHDQMAMAMRPPHVADAEPSDTLPPGVIRITVVDQNDAPVANAELNVGIMAQGGDRDRLQGRTGPSGTHVFQRLATGSQQAYRVNVPYQGATYSSTPFQLPTDRGYDVRVWRLPVTHQPRRLLQVVGQTIFEVNDERLHVIHQAELTNFGDETYVVPQSGILFHLPPGFLVFQSQPVMTDQRIEEVPGVGARLRGSFPPGHVSLAWAYDLPVSHDEMQIPVDIPFPTFTYRVIAEAIPGLRLAVDGMPAAQSTENQGQPLLYTEVQRGPDSGRLDRIVCRVSGIPGPGPWRWIAVIIALCFVIGGGFLALSSGDPRAALAASRRARQEVLLAEARQLERDFAAEEIGPEYRQKRRSAIVRELAALLLEEKASDRPRVEQRARVRANRARATVSTGGRAAPR